MSRELIAAWSTADLDAEVLEKAGDSLADALASALDENEKLRAKVAGEVAWWQEVGEDHAGHLMFLRAESLRRLTKAGRVTTGTLQSDAGTVPMRNRVIRASDALWDAVQMKAAVCNVSVSAVIRGKLGEWLEEENLEETV